MKYRLTEEQLQKILKALNSDQRIELIPLKDHVKVMIIQRSEAK